MPSFIQPRFKTGGHAGQDLQAPDKNTRVVLESLQNRGGTQAKICAAGHPRLCHQWLDLAQDIYILCGWPSFLVYALKHTAMIPGLMPVLVRVDPRLAGCTRDLPRALDLTKYSRFVNSGAADKK